MRSRCGFVSVECLAVLALLAAGCSTGPAMSEVTGVVQVNGKPLEGIVVEFSPVDGSIGASRTVTDSDGRFRMRFNRQKTGVIVGTHRVRFAEGDSKAKFDLVPGRYQGQDSGVIAEVTAAGPNEFTFDLNDG
ncbi:carboxypeptidase regulatory-like domain-containing protein [Planctomicrobium sp. SH661]|uniref:carboxypeptidase regulatory-like domain-containing protein n=1 Tax=Planctomicrobium sp. SH661 TaxID=3448124 RepID=UPI003F5C633F